MRPFSTTFPVVLTNEGGGVASTALFFAASCSRSSAFGGYCTLKPVLAVAVLLPLVASARSV